MKDMGSKDEEKGEGDETDRGDLRGVAPACQNGNARISK